MSTGKINISLTKSALDSNFVLLVNGHTSDESPSAYASSKEGYVGWLCKSCGRSSKMRSLPYKTNLITRANGHYYSRCGYSYEPDEPTYYGLYMERIS